MTLAPSRNADLVSLTIEAGGAPLPDSVPVLAVEVVQQANRIPFARLRLADGDPAAGDFPVSAGDLFRPGSAVRVLAGYHGDVAPLFSGLVTRQRVVVRRGGSWLEVECRSPAFKMTLSRRSRHFEEIKDSELAEALLAEHGLTADILATEAVHPALVQYQASDWDFLVGRLEASGQLVAVDGEQVRSYRPSLDAEADAEILYGATLLELDAELDARAASGAVRARAWDPAGQELVEAEAGDPAWAAGGDLAAEDLAAAAGREEDLLWHGGFLAAEALQAWADGALLRSRLATTRGRARFQGLAGLGPGSVVALAGLGLRFDGKVHVTGVRHELTAGDWLTDVEFGLGREIQAERFAVAQLPAGGLAPPVSGLQIGLVLQLADDPAGEQRIKVHMPIAGAAQDGLWARVATLDAGDGRGTFFRPEVGDEVLLGFLHDDPAQPVVLGMLHSSAKPAPLAAAEDNHQKAYVSRSGIKLLFDDDRKAVSLETPGGNKLSLSDGDGGLILADQNGNKLVMDQNGIQLESAKALIVKAAGDLAAEATNAELKTKAGLKLQAKTAAELTCAGKTTIKGALVEIN